MSYVLTFVAADPDSPITQGRLEDARGLLAAHDVQQTCAPVWLSENKAVDIGVSKETNRETMAALRDLCEEHKTDVFINHIERRRKKLLLADMDSTIVTSETLDELAAFADLKSEIAAITADAMEGRLDFHQALRRRVSLLKDLPITALDKTLEGTQISPGAEIFVKTMRKHKAHCVLVSGGFTFFTNAIGERLGFHKNHGNTLELEGEFLSGRVRDPIQDKFAKLEYLNEYVDSLNITPNHVLAIGDGANDVPMLQAAGLGIGYKPKEIVLSEVNNAIIHGDLTAALYAQGYREDEFAA